MLKSLLSVLAVGAALLSHGQARLVFAGTGPASGQHPFIVFNPDANVATNPGAYLVIDNPNVNAISYQGGLSNNAPVIKTEAPQNKIRWATRTSTGTYTIPYSTGTTLAGVAMPLSVQITTAGAGGADASLVLSTWNYLGGNPLVLAADYWDNLLYRPSDVTHMHDAPTGAVMDNSANAIDRFWTIDTYSEAPYAYSTRPAVSLTFGFDPAETAQNGAPGNSPTLAAANNNLVAQRFNSTLNKWNDIVVLGAQAGNTVAGVAPPTTADFFRSWTLSNKQLPLPITLVAWGGECSGKSVQLKWATASEQDNAYFTIEKSRDANDWTTIGTVPGAGNSSQMMSYSFTDDGAQGLGYYRLRQTDINGTTTVSNTIAAGCGTDNGTAIVNAWDDGNYLNLVVSSTMDAVYDLTLMDAQGKVMATHASQVINTGSTTLRVDKRDIATGIYMVQLLNNTNMMSRRVHLD